VLWSSRRTSNAIIDVTTDSSDLATIAVNMRGVIISRATMRNENEAEDGKMDEAHVTDALLSSDVCSSISTWVLY
jgi:hypothetical protein